ncbi:MAG: hypothetical protein QXJ75_05260 [Candidatus Bathyarchaeia archaeon]
MAWKVTKSNMRERLMNVGVPSSDSSQRIILTLRLDDGDIETRVA